MINKISFGFLAMIAFAAFSFVDRDSKSVTTYKVDTQKSAIVWTGKKVTGAHTGNISLSKGTITADGKTIKGGTFEIDMNSITVTDLKDSTYNKKLVGHLKNDDFFGVEKHPKATFVITKVTPKTGNEYDVTGKLTIKGITHDVSFPATITTTANSLTAIAKIAVDRTKYDIKYGSGSFFDNLGDKAIDNDFTLDLNLVAVK
jgi:polyisoprenoid-binding protein YceI